jgi:gluconolactonase
LRPLKQSKVKNITASSDGDNKIFRVYSDGHKETLISLGDPDGNTYDQQQRLIDCASVLRASIRIGPDGNHTILANRFEGKKFDNPNDVVLGPDEATYFTDPTLDLPPGEKQEIPFQGVYRLDAKGEVRLLTKGFAQPNGLAFSPDGKRFYVDDNKQRNIRVYDFKADGTLANGRIFAEEPGGKGDGVPYGMKVDREGNLFRYRPKGDLGLGFMGPPSRHDSPSATTRQPRMGAIRILGLSTLPRQLPSIACEPPRKALFRI